MKRKIILVVEDEKNIRENIAELLSFENYNVHIASNGTQGFLKACEIQPDLILSDIMMPELDGFQLLEKVRTVKELKNTPFIFLTAKSDRKDQRFGMGLGADDFILKPFTTLELLESINTRLNKKENIELEISNKIAEIQFNINNTTAHEFNTPLNGIIGFSELIIDYGDSFNKDEIKDYCKMIHQAGLRLKQTIDKTTLFRSLFTLGQNGEHLGCFNSGKTTIGPFVLETIKTTIEKEIGSKFDIMIDVGTEIIEISEENLNRILYELIENAVKFGFENQRISVRSNLDGKKYEIEISNFGREMSVDEIKSIGPFIQFNRKKFEQQGSGLGLYIVKKLVELNNGIFSIKSKNGQTTIKISLPLVEYE